MIAAVRRALAIRRNRQRIARLEAEIERDLAAIRIASNIRSDAAKRGVSASWCRRGAAARKLYAN